jgi:hypothetical protein
MKTDLYTKAVLTVIALMLAVIALKPVISPEMTASAQGSFDRFPVCNFPMRATAHSCLTLEPAKSGTIAGPRPYDGRLTKLWPAFCEVNLTKARFRVSGRKPDNEIRPCGVPFYCPIVEA